MKIKTLSFILVILLIPVCLCATEKAESTAKVKFIVGDIMNFGYSADPIASITDEATPVEEVTLADDSSRLVNIGDVYAYWQVNLSKRGPVKLLLTITEDMVNALEALVSEEERTMTLPMTVEVVNGETTKAVITGKSSGCVVYEGGYRPEYGYSLLRISCPIENDTNAGEYKGEITLTLEV